MTSKKGDDGGEPADALDRWAKAQSGGKKGDDSSDADDQDDDDADNKDGKNEGKPSIFKSVWFKIAIVIILLLLIAGGIVWWLNARQYEDTDDAFIDTHIVQISPQIAGQILAIHVTDNQAVRQGQPLVDIDSADERTKLEQTQAQRVQAETQIAQARANERGAAAQVVNTGHDLARYRTLQKTAPAAVAQQQVDQAVAANRNAVAQRDAAVAQIASAEAQITVLDTQIQTAQLNLGYAHIVAPVSGHVAQRNVAPGNYVSPGQQLMALVPQQLWITANFKETQLALMRRGQSVTVVIDSCDKQADGHVDSVQRGAGQAFGILPPENATGNYVKVVQRVPVKIVLDHVPSDCIIGPGMSVEPTVKVR